MIDEGLYVPTHLGKRAHIWHRYVLGEVNGVVRYTRGGGQHFMCKAKTFQKWIERYKAQRKVGDTLSERHLDLPVTSTGEQTK